MNYRYMAVDREQRIIHGTLQAMNDRAVEERLTREGLRAILIESSSRPTWVRKLLPSASTKVTKKDLVLFSQQLATLMSAGTPMLTAIHLLGDQARTAAFKDVLNTLVEDLKEGLPLHKSMAQAPKVFPKVFVKLVEAGEQSGTLETLLRHIASYMQKEMVIVQQVKKATTYPAIVGAVGFIVIIILVTFVLPSLTQLLQGFGTKLPPTTRLIIGLSNFVQTWKLHLLIGMVATIFAATSYVKRPSGRRQFDRLVMKLPGFGRLTVQHGLARFSRTVSLLLGAGMPMAEALLLAKESVSNTIFQEAIVKARAEIEQGSTLAQSLGATPFMPGLFVQMVKVGEESGALETNLTSMADFYEREVEDQLNTMVGLLEPAMTVFMGVVVGFIALSVLLPMFDLMDAIGESQ